jgi:cobalt-zinc-cadmium efflux system protein
LGIVVNAGTAMLFFRDRHSDLNASGAFTHLAADAAVSAGVALSGAAIAWTGLFWIDPAASFVIIAVILYSAWSILRRAIRLSLDGVPHNVNPEDVRTAAKRVKGVKDIHHVHIWALSTTQNAITAHVLVSEGMRGGDISRIKKSIRHELLHANVHHATLEFEYSAEDCGDTPLLSRRLFSQSLNRGCGQNHPFL